MSDEKCEADSHIVISADGHGICLRYVFACECLAARMAKLEAVAGLVPRLLDVTWSNVDRVEWEWGSCRTVDKLRAELASRLDTGKPKYDDDEPVIVEMERALRALDEGETK